MTSYVFISHASSDADLALTLSSRVEARGWTCWMAPRDVVGGKSWVSQIVDGIESCEVFLLLLTEAANDSSHVGREVQTAIDLGKPVVALRESTVTPQTDLGFLLNSTHWLAFEPGNLPAAFEALETSLRLFVPPQNDGQESTAGSTVHIGSLINQPATQTNHVPLMQPPPPTFTAHPITSTNPPPEIVEPSRVPSSVRPTGDATTTGPGTQSATYRAALEKSGKTNVNLSHPVVQNGWIVATGFLLCWPIGMVLLWNKKSLSTSAKITITAALVVAYLIVAVAVSISSAGGAFVESAFQMHSPG